MKKWMKKKILPTATGVLVLGVGVVVLSNATGLDNLFEPSDFEEFQNRYKSDKYNYVAGDGENAELADQDQNSSDNVGNSDQTLQMADSQLLSNLAGGLDGMGMADGNSSLEENLNSYIISPDAQGTIGTVSGGSADGGSGSGTGSGSDNNASGSGSKNDSNKGNTGNNNDNTIDNGGLSAYEKNQLQSKLDEITSDGRTLTKLTAVFNTDVKPYYTVGETYSAEDAKVTLTYKKDGHTYTDVLPYGGDDGYSVSFSTSANNRGQNNTAVFRYHGLTARAHYTVALSSVMVYYYAESDGSPYSSVFPGAGKVAGPLKDLMGTDSAGTSVFETFQKRAQANYNYAIKGNVIDLSDMHRYLIAFLGDDNIQNVFKTYGDNEGSASSVVLLQEDEDGYLTNMLTGFRTFQNHVFYDDRGYIFYPVLSDWGSVGKTVLDCVEKVPDGFLIRREADPDSNWWNFKGDQTLVGYIGTEETLEVPMGVTKISFEKIAESVKILKIPQSVQIIDAASIAKYLPNLENFEYEDDSLNWLNCTIIDGVIYSKDGTEVVSVPAGRKEYTVPSQVTTLDEDCLAALGSDAVISFEGDLPSTIVNKTGFHGTVKVPASEDDSIYKDLMFLFGEESKNIIFQEEGTAETQNRYTYVTENDGTDNLYSGTDSTVLAAAGESSTGSYTVSPLVTEIADGAFVGCDEITDITIGNGVKKFQEGSLRLPSGVQTIFLNTDHVIETDSHIFGDSETADLSGLQIQVTKKMYDSYLTVWTEILDPVYGEGTAAGLLAVSGDVYVYEDGAKYQEIYADGQITYRLISLYAKEKTAFAVKEGTTQISANALSDVDKLEILYLPESLQTLDTGFFDGADALETVAVANPALAKRINDSKGESTEVLIAGQDYDGFEYEDGVLYGITDDKATLINVRTDYDKELKVRKNTSVLGRAALLNCSKLRIFQLTDDASLTEIQDDCFRGCSNFLNVDYALCKNLVKIGKRAFADCTSIQSAKLPETVNIISTGMFANDSVLTTVEATGIQTIGDQAFYGCQVLNFLSDGVLDSVTSLGKEAFYGCRSLKSVVLPSTLESMGESCFENCAILNSVELNGSLTVISRYSFYGCRGLEKFTIGEDQLTKLKLIGAEAFGQCENLQIMDLTGASALAYLGEGAFEGSTELLTVKLPASVSEIPAACFDGCKNLSLLQFENPALVKLGVDCFGTELSEYLHIWVKDELLENYIETYNDSFVEIYATPAEDVFGVIDDTKRILSGVVYERAEDGNGWILLSAPKKLSGEFDVPVDTVRITDDAFSGCTKLEYLVFPRESTVELGDRCFKGCTGLQIAYLYGNIPEWGEETFMDCTSLYQVCVGYGGNTVIPRIGVRAFKNCTAMGTQANKYFSIRAAVKVLDTECLAGCSNMTAIAFITTSIPAVEEIGDSAFEGCTKLVSLLNTKFTGLKKIGNYAFRNCDSMKQPSLPASVTSIGEGCFMDCDNLAYVSIYGAIEEYPKDCFKNCPKLIRTGGTAAAFGGLKRIGESAYEGCKSLTLSTSWNFGRYTALEEIGDNAFKGCSGLTLGTMETLDLDKIQFVAFPATLKSVGDSVFDDCTNLQYLYFKSTEPPTFGSISMEGRPEGFTILVSDSQEEEDAVYKAYFEKLMEYWEWDGPYVYEILDSLSDGAKERNPWETEETETAEASETEETEGAEEGEGGEDTEETEGGEDGGDTGGAENSGTDSSTDTDAATENGTTQTDTKEESES